MTEDSLPPSVGIVGLGLIGGSLARDLVRAGVSVMAHDRDAARLRSLDDPVLARIALHAGVEALAAAPVVVVAVPVDEALDVLARLAPHITPSHVVLDVGSAKRAIVAHARSLGIGRRFVGCHPLAGSHRSGWEASRGGLFAGAPVFVSPTPETDPDALSAARALWRATGACVEVEDAGAHDARMAAASHLPHAVSAALALALRDAGRSRAELGPGGRDLTRLAGSSPESWAAIFVQNREPLAAALLVFERRLRGLRQHIAAADPAALARDLASARDWFDAS